MPLEPGMRLPEPASRFVPRRELENLSIGLGRGQTAAMEGTRQLLTQPVATAQALIEAARQLGTDPRIVLDMLRAARQKAMSGSLGLGELIGENVTPGFRNRRPTLQELDVYQGSPHRYAPTENNPFGELDSSKIGTGEGAQAYGYGHYLAESPTVAKFYQNPNAGSAFLGRRSINVGGQTFGTRKQLIDARNAATDNTERAMFDILATAQELGIDGPQKLAKAVKAKPVRFGSYEFGQEALDAAMKRIRKEVLFSSQKGHLYKADLPDEMIDRMLDWDKPLSQQPAAVRNLFPTVEEAKTIDAEMIRLSEAALAANDINSPAQAAWDAMYKSPRYRMARIVVDEADPKLRGKFANGQEIYRAISGGNDKAASEQLKSMGIPGIKYLDAGSRGQGGSGTRNFVVFPGEEKRVRIFERK